MDPKESRIKLNDLPTPRIPESLEPRALLNIAVEEGTQIGDEEMTGDEKSESERESEEEEEVDEWEDDEEGEEID